MKEYIDRQYEAPELFCIELDETCILCASQFGTDDLRDQDGFNDNDFNIF